jgi:hypothetical protein
MQVVNSEDENRWADLARRIVAAEVEDALTGRADEQPTAEHMDLAALLDAVATSSDAEPCSSRSLPSPVKRSSDCPGSWARTLAPPSSGLRPPERGADRADHGATGRALSMP